MQAVIVHIAAGHLQGVRRNIDRIDLGFGKRQGGQDGQAARAGAHVQRARHRRRIPHPGRQAMVQQLGDGRARHDHPLVDIEAVAAQPGLVRQVGGRQALVHAPVDQVQHAFALLAQHARVQERIQRVGRQVQAMQHQVDGLVPGIVGAMAQGDVAGMEARHRVADQVAQGLQFLAVGRGIKLNVPAAGFPTCAGRCSSGGPGCPARYAH